VHGGEQVTVLDFLPRFWLLEAVDVIDASLCVKTPPPPMLPPRQPAVQYYDTL
jgi:hypothetical protein